MANRRMFSLDVVDTDLFLEMPATSQNLYFHLGMRADDDGFVSAPKKITKAVNCGMDDLNILIARGFLIPFNDGVVVIRHWKQNNYIRPDRYKATVYQENMEMLTEQNGVYDLVYQNSTNGIPSDIPLVENLDTQDRLGKDSIDKNKVSEGKEGSGEKPRLDSIHLLEQLIPDYNLSDSVVESLRSWIRYKSERHEPYKKQGMKSLLSQVEKHVDECGDASVCELIEMCMSNGWKGIIWDKLQNIKVVGKGDDENATGWTDPEDFYSRFLGNDT